MAVNATAIWRARPSGSNANGGGYDPGISGAATDYSRQNAAQATGSHGTATGTTTFTDTVAANFTSAMIGNAIQIVSGAGFTAGFYFVTAFGSSTSVTLDRSPGTGTVAVWNLGGGWRDFWTNTVVTTGPVVAGNIVYILGSGTPNSSSYVYDYTFAGAGTAVSLQTGDTTNGCVSFLNDPATPGYKAPPDTTGGMPVIKVDGTFINNISLNQYAGLYFVASAANGGSVILNCNSASLAVFGCVFDFFGFGVVAVQITDRGVICGNEVFSSVAPGSSSSGLLPQGSSIVLGNNIHDISTTSGVIQVSGNGNATIEGNIVAKCTGDAIQITVPAVKVVNNTIDGNTGHGITVNNTTNLSSCAILNNIISNHTGVGKFGLTILAGTATANSQAAQFVDYNSFYNNTANYNGINAGPHDTALGVTPYNASATEDYKLI